ncbi:SAM-dependent methyltransferase [Actinomadura sp. 9N407]|uniref:SAM-dependent methyltransferase n=1 Tax=Actinomadura sp. 9N407 TaxID=3375154 RepID=UPI003790B324
MPTDELPPEWVIDPHRPSVARMYDYYLGGKDNFEADRAAAERAIAAVPSTLAFTRANRCFLAKAVTMLAERGVRQFLDIGSGLPTQENVHQVAQRAAPDAKVAYVDNDPIVLVHARALLADSERTKVIEADLREPESILHDETVQSHFDFDEPIALLMLAVLHFVPEEADPYGIVEKLKAPLAAGSHVVISHGHAGEIPEALEEQVRGAYGRTEAGDIVPRGPERVMRFFDGCDLLPPGLVPVEDWQPGVDFFEPDLSRAGFIGGVGALRRRPAAPP